MPTTNPTGASTWQTIIGLLPAACSAFAAWMMFIIQGRNSLDGVRPEIVVDDWRFLPHQQPRGFGWIGVHKLKKAGRGAALNVWAKLEYAKGTPAPAPFVALVHRRIAVIEPGQEVAVLWEALFTWPERDLGPMNMQGVNLTVWADDVLGRRHECVYFLTAFEEQALMVPTMARLTEGLYLASRRVRVTPRWRVRLAARWNRVRRRWEKLRQNGGKAAPPTANSQ